MLFLPTSPGLFRLLFANAGAACNNVFPAAAPERNRAGGGLFCLPGRSIAGLEGAFAKFCQRFRYPEFICRYVYDYGFDGVAMIAG